MLDHWRQLRLNWWELVEAVGDVLYYWAHKHLVEEQEGIDWVDE